MARRHAINANQVFHWRKLYRAGLLTDSAPGMAVRNRGVRLLPVAITADADCKPELSTETKQQARASEPSSTALAAMELSLAKAQVRIVGAVDAEVVRAVLECLLR